MSDESNSSSEHDDSSGDDEFDEEDVVSSAGVGGLQPYMYEPEAGPNDPPTAATAALELTAGRMMQDVSDW